MSAGFSKYDYGRELYTNLMEYIKKNGGWEKFTPEDMRMLVINLIDSNVRDEISGIIFNQGNIILEKLGNYEKYLPEYREAEFGSLDGYTNNRDPYTLIDEVSMSFYNNIMDRKDSLDDINFMEPRIMRDSMDRIIELVRNIAEYYDLKYASLDKTARIGIVCGIVFGSILIYIILYNIVQFIMKKTGKIL